MVIPMARRAASAYPTCGYAWGAAGGTVGFGAVGAPGVAGVAGVFWPGMPGAAGSSTAGSGSLQNGHVTGRKLGDTIFLPHAGQMSGPDVVSGGLKHMAIPFLPRAQAPRCVIRPSHYKKKPTGEQTTNDPTPINRLLRRLQAALSIPAERRPSVRALPWCLRPARFVLPCGCRSRSSRRCGRERFSQRCRSR